ncbi:MAG TPA: hypothetical protein VFZ53_12335 [Polyangiaceae bacterium]
MSQANAERMERSPCSATNHRNVDSAIHERPAHERTLATESAWSLLRETFECRDFDDSLVFAE